jgi:uncharacterized protein
MNLTELEQKLRTALKSQVNADDPAHDFEHFERVSRTAKKLAASENADPRIVIPAAWLHDLVVVPKNDPRRKEASKLSADAAETLLRSFQFPEDLLPWVKHAILCHSFSANIPPQSIEAKVVQDADRLDGLGAIGVARCFVTAGLLKRPLYHTGDPFCETREPNDQLFTLDHFYQKLFKVAQSLQTDSGRAEGIKRLAIMEHYLESLKEELL